MRTGDYMSNKSDFLGTLRDKEYRKIFNEEQVGVALAFQIRQLRDAQELTQAALAELTGKAQETISQWENPNYGRYTLKTLKELAGALDVALLVRFVSFGELFEWSRDVHPGRAIPAHYEEEQEQDRTQRMQALADASFTMPAALSADNYIVTVAGGFAPSASGIGAAPYEASLGEKFEEQVIRQLEKEIATAA